MNFRRVSRFVLILPLLVNALSLHPVQASPGLADNTALVIWCPVAVTAPTPKLNGCTNAFAKMSDLVAALDNKEPTVAGVVWIGKNYNSANALDGNFSFDGAIL